MVLHDRSTPVLLYPFTHDNGRPALVRSLARRFPSLPGTIGVAPRLIRTVLTARIPSSDIERLLVRQGSDVGGLSSKPSLLWFAPTTVRRRSPLAI